MRIAGILIAILIGVFLLPAFCFAVQVATFNPSTAINGRVLASAPIIIADQPAWSATNGAARAAVRVYTKNQEVVPADVIVPDDVTPEVSGLIGETDHKRNVELRVWISDWGGGTEPLNYYYRDSTWDTYWAVVIDEDDPVNDGSMLALRPLFRYGYPKTPAVPPGGVDLGTVYVYFAIEITDAIAQEYESEIYFDVVWE